MPEEQYKSPYSSKLNWAGAAMLAIGLFSDPTFKDYLGAIMPEEVLSKVMAGFGLLTIVLRTFFTSRPVR